MGQASATVDARTVSRTYFTHSNGGHVAELVVAERLYFQKVEEPTFPRKDPGPRTREGICTGNSKLEKKR